MIRVLNAYFPRRTVFLGISEACLVAVAFAIASLERMGSGDSSVLLRYPDSLPKLLLLSTAFITCMYYFNLYESAVLANPRETVTRLIQAFGIVYAVMAVFYYLYPTLKPGHDIFQIGFVLVAIVLCLWRTLFLVVNRTTQFAERVLLIGEGPLAEALLHQFESRPELGVRIVGRDLATDNGTQELSSERLSAMTNQDLWHALKRLRANRMIIAMDDRRGKLPVEQLLAMKSRGLRVQDGTEVYEAITGKIPIESLGLGWLLFSPGCHSSLFFLFYKRLASMVISLVGLLLSLPLVPFISLAIRLSSSGSILYKQRRVGRDGIVFWCYKFRTMWVDAEADSGPTWAADRDPRITSVGRFLRRSHMDEIPQLWNVLVGDMSFIGPRPERPEFVQGLSREIPYYELRHTIRPGITGWAQVRCKYGNSVEDAKEKLRYDLFYIKNMSLGLDFLVFFQTIRIILWGGEAG